MHQQFTSREEKQKREKKTECIEGGGKTKYVAANPPNHHLDSASAAISPAGKGGGEVPGQPLGSEHAKSCPEDAFRFSSRGPSFLRLCSQSYFQRIPVKTPHFSPGFSLGPDRRRGRGWKAGCGRHWHRAPKGLLGRPSPLHVGGHSWAAPRRARQRFPVSPTPTPRPPRRRLPTPQARGGASLNSKDKSRSSCGGGAGGSGSYFSPFFTPLG